MTRRCSVAHDSEMTPSPEKGGSEGNLISPIFCCAPLVVVVVVVYHRCSTLEYLVPVGEKN